MEEAFHKRLKRLRTASGFNIKAFARKIGVPESTYRTWEAGGGIQGQPYLKMSQSLGVSLHELLSGESREPKNLLALIDKIDELNKEIKKEILSFF